jgi:hypothetical protein
MTSTIVELGVEVCAPAHFVGHPSFRTHLLCANGPIRMTSLLTCVMFLLDRHRNGGDYARDRFGEAQTASK